MATKPEEKENSVIRDIPLKDIRVNADNEKIFSLHDLKGLKDSIESAGFLGAIEVYRLPGDKYQISSGHRRYQAMKELGRETIPCIIKDIEDPITIKKKLILGNLNNRVLSPIEKSRSIIYYEAALLEEGFTGSLNEELRKIFSLTARQLRTLKSLSKMVKGIQDLATGESFPYETLEDVVKFPKEYQMRFYELIKEHKDKYPESELSSLVVTQYVNQVKKEIDINKSKESRQSILRQSLEEEMAYTQNLMNQESRNVPVIKSYDKIIELPKEEDREPVVIKSYQNVDALKIVRPTDTDDRNYYVDFEMELYLSKMEKAVSLRDASFESASNRISIIERMKNMIITLENMN